MLKWTRTGKGWYREESGRFSIQPADRGGYMLIDSTRKDPIQPEYNWMTHCHTIMSAKRWAEKIVARDARDAAMVKS